MKKEISCENNNKICLYCLNTGYNSWCLNGNIAKCMMNNIEVESLDKGIVIMGDLELVGWVVWKVVKLHPPVYKRRHIYITVIC